MIQALFSSDTFYRHRVAWLGGLYFAVMLLLSAIFYKERCTYMDVAFQTFEMVRTGVPATQVYRFGSVMTQIFPLLAIWIKAPLWVVGLCYSLGVVFYQALIFIYLASVRKSERWALVFLLCQTMLTAHMFFWIQSEFSQSIPWIILLLCRLDTSSASTRSIFSSVIDGAILVTMVFFHPLSFPVFLLGVFLLLLVRREKQQRITWLVSVLFAAAVYAVKRIWFDNWYDHGAHERSANVLTMFPHYFNTDSTRQFLQHSSWLYVGLWLSLGLLLGLLLFHRQWFKALLGMSIPAAYFFFINVTHPQAAVFYLENFYLGIPLLLAIMLVYWIPWKETGKISPILLFLSVGMALMAGLRFVQLDPIYAARLDGYRELLSAYAGQKIILEEKQVDMKRFIMSWPSPYEIWMLSQMEQGHTASVFITDDANKYRDYRSQNRSFFGLQIYPYDSLPARYFSFPDTVSQYQMVP